MEKVEEKEPIIFEIEEQKLFGVLHMPLKKGKVPAVLICHGLAGNKTGRSRVYVKLSKELAKEGIASLRIDFRGCGDSDGEFSETTVTGFIQDALVSLQFLMNHENIDPKRLGLFGRSFGAVIALMTAYEFKKIKSLALWAPLYDTLQWQEKWRHFNDKNTPKHIQDMLLSVDGQKGSSKFFDEFFKINLETKLDFLHDTPLLHIHGVKDSIIDIHHADSYKMKRQAATAPSEFIRLENGDHDFSESEDQLVAIRGTVNWFHKTL